MQRVTVPLAVIRRYAAKGVNHISLLGAAFVRVERLPQNYQQC